LSGAKSSTLSFPLISVINGGDKAFGARLEVTLPSQVALVGVSASNATCSGSTVLRCDFSELDAGVIATVALTVRATVSGNFASSLKLTASNDSNSANDSREVALAISSGEPAEARVGKSGGGRIEFWMLALLGALVVVRSRRRRS
jgi:MYXO-CTERM domain-containing protein